jgi:hypothetical protein
MSRIPPPFPSKSGLKLVCNENIVYGILKSDNSQDYGQKPQRHCTFMNSASEHSLKLCSIFMEIAGVLDLQFVECLDKQFLQNIVGKIAAQYYRRSDLIISYCVSTVG